MLTIETGTLRIHQVVELAFADGPLALGEVHDLPILLFQLLLGCREFAALIESAADGVNRPVVEDGSAAVNAREALLVHAALAELLSSVDHQRILMEPGADHHAGYSATGITGKEVTGQSLLVVVLQEVEHVRTDIVGSLPFVGDGSSRPTATDHIAHTIVHAHLVVEQVESGMEIATVLLRIIDLADKLNLRIAELHLIRGPRPEGSGHHLGHVATECIHALLGPEEQDVGHLIPSVGYGVEVFRTSTGIAVINAVVEFHGLVPVVGRRTVGETVVARSLGGILPVGLLGAELRQVERLSPAIVEVVLR